MTDNVQPMNILITGATDGIGKKMALQLVAEGHNVAFTGRNQQKVTDVDQELRAVKRRKQNVDQKITPYCFDIGNLESVRRELDTSMDSHPFDTVIFNAGVMFPSRRPPTEDDKPELEDTLKTNVLGHYLIARRLIDKAKGEGRLVSFVFVSSIMAGMGARHRRWPSTKSDFYPFFERQFLSDGWLSYIDSKLAAVVIAQKLADESLKENSGVKRAVAIHPGIAHTNMFDSMPFLQRMILSPMNSFKNWLQSKTMDSTEKCADRVIHEAVYDQNFNSIDTWICEGPKPIPNLSPEQKDSFMEFILDVTNPLY